jgi:SAM-dependent methyltransferase
VSPDELQAISDEVGELEGWDFSRVRVVEDEPPWQYDDVVRRHLTATSVALDLGTGGGEVFLSFAPLLHSGYGIEQDRGRLRTAVRNQREAATENIRFLAMDVDRLGFLDRSFDVVLAKYANYHVGEVLRLLRPGGVFITQQMGDRDTQNIFDTFGWGSYGYYWRTQYAVRGSFYKPTMAAAREFEAAGCEIVRCDEYDLCQYYQDVGSLVFFLKASPLPWPFDPETYAAPLTKLLENHGSERGIQTNAHRELLVVRR